MTRRDHLLLTALAVTGFLLSLWQCWYVYLPQEQAAAVDWCRFRSHIDCFESLSKYGAALYVWKLPVFPLMAALFFYQSLLALFAWTVTADKREAWNAIGRLLAFPVAGLAIFVLLHDYSVAKVTSASAILVTAVAVWLCVDTVVRGLRGIRLTRGARGTFGFLLLAILLGWFISGAGNAKLEIEQLIREREAAPPNIRYAEFAPQVPRAGAAHLGEQTAPVELLLFLDPTDRASRTVMSDMAALAAQYRERVFVYVFAGPDALLAHRAGQLGQWLRNPEPAGDPESVAAIVARQEEARQALGIETVPAAVWGRAPEQRAVGAFRMRHVLEKAAAARPK